MTRGARAFLQPLTFEGLIHRRVFTDVFEGWEDGGTGHVSLAREADVLVIAPATANTLARLAHGMVDDMLSAIALATQAPIVLAPAMEHHMWHHDATRGNLRLLRDRGAVVVGPAEGRLASGAMGTGRLAPTAEIVDAIRGVLGQHGPLAGKRMVVTAGGTQEALDPVRFLGNRSSGRMGVAIANAARSAGADVQVIATRSVARELVPAQSVVVESAQDLEIAVTRAVATADVLVMAAAVADFRPATAAEHKIKKRPGQEVLSLELVRTPDIIAGVSQPGLLKVGFAAETEDLEANAQRKLSAKGMHMIVANNAVATIGQARSRATIFVPGQAPSYLPEADKELVAEAIVVHIIRLLEAGVADA
jgi:phosphopantothenoylcysteine decarboxylase/phosphopantothenate--cysteine ligase